jgi:hypothetical protein
VASGQWPVKTNPTDVVCCFRMKALTGQSFLVVASLIGLAGCASIGPPLPPVLELPKAPSDLRAVRKGEKVTLTWTVPARTTDRQMVRYLGKTRVCRSVDAALVSCGDAVGEVAPPADFAATNKSATKKLTASFTDTLPSSIEQANPMGFASYAVEVLNATGRGAGISNVARVPLVPTLPPFGGFTAQATGQGVLISWQCHPASGRKTGVKYLFRIYRRPESGQGATRIAEMDATECAAGPGGLVPLPGQASGAAASAPNESNTIITSFLDQSFEWEKTYFYRGAVVSVVEVAGKPAAEVEGDDTPEVKLWAHDVFPPAVPSGVQAVFSGVGQEAFIDLIWAPVTDADLDGYNVYRREENGVAVKVNDGPVKTPGYRDQRVVSGKTYFYSVSAVDVRGNESGRSEEAGERAP